MEQRPYPTKVRMKSAGFKSCFRGLASVGIIGCLPVCGPARGPKSLDIKCPFIQGRYSMEHLGLSHVV